MLTSTKTLQDLAGISTLTKETGHFQEEPTNRILSKAALKKIHQGNPYNQVALLVTWIGGLGD